jgi:ribosome-associated toxin RatA of RatAB toxin-antitoxin module
MRVVFAFAAVLAVSAAGAADDMSVEATRRGAAVEVVARATVRAAHEVVWSTLTDYDRLHEFIPGLRKSRLIEYRGSTAIVDQAGEARLLVLSFPIEVTLASTERPPSAIDVRLLKGNLKRLDGGYRIEPSGDQWLLRWTGLLEPEEPLPPLIGEVLVRLSIEDQFFGMVREIERREALRRDKDKGKKP